MTELLKYTLNLLDYSFINWPIHFYFIGFLYIFIGIIWSSIQTSIKKNPLLFILGIELIGLGMILILLQEIFSDFYYNSPYKMFLALMIITTSSIMISIGLALIIRLWKTK